MGQRRVQFTLPPEGATTSGARVEQPQAINPLPWLVDRAEEALALGQELLCEFEATQTGSDKVRVFNLHQATTADCVRLAKDLERCLDAVELGRQVQQVIRTVPDQEVRLEAAEATEFLPGDDFFVVDIQNLLSYIQDLPGRNPGVDPPQREDVLLTCVQLLVLRVKTFFEDSALRGGQDRAVGQQPQNPEEPSEGPGRGAPRQRG